MIPTPGISNIGNGNTGAAVGRNDMPSRHFSVTHPPFPNQTEIGNNVISHATGKLSSLPGHANGMFQLQNPDGGIISNVFDSTTQMVTMNGSTGQRLAYPNIEYMTGTQLQQFAVKQNGHLYSHMSRQTNGIPRNINFTMENSFLGSTDRILNKRMEFLGTGPHMPNINPHSVKTRGILNTNCNSHAPTSVKQQGDLQSQEHLIQSLSKHLPLLPDCGYAMNAADLMASGNLYHVSPGRLSTRGSLNDITRGMLPKTGGQDSGLSNEQQKLHPPAQQMQMQPIGSDSRSYPSMLSMQSQLPLQKSHEFRNQYFEEQFYPCYSTQQVQQGQHTETVRNGIPNYHSSSVTSGQGEVGMQTLSKDTPEQKILDQQEVSLVSSDLQHHDKCSFAQQMPVSNENMFDSQESYNHQPQMSQQLLYNAIQRSQSNNGSNDRSSQIGFQVQHESISNESSLTENVSYSLQEHRSQQLAPERGRTKDNVDKEQHLPEENSNNNESSGLTQVSSSTTSADNLDHQVNVDAEALRKEYRKQQHFLLLLRHSIRCSAGDGKCRKSSHCFEMRKLADHLSKCHEEQCSNLYCRQARKLVKHHMECRNPRCPVCGPLRNRRKKNTMGNGLSNPSTNSEVLNITVEKETQSSSQAVSGAVLKSLAIEQPLSGSINESTFPRLAKQEAEMVPSPKTNIQSNALKRCLHIDESDMHSCTQHLVLEPDKQANYSTESISSPLENNTVGTQDQECIEKRHSPKKLKMELNDTKQEGNMEASQMAYSNNMPQVSFSDHQLVLQSDHQLLEAYKDARPNIEGRQPQIQMSPKSDLVGVPSRKSRTNMKEDLPQVKNGTMTDVPSSIVSSSAKVGKPKAKGVSLTELFTSSQIRDHIRGLRQWVGQSKAKAEKYQAMEHHMTENSCRLCAVERLTFEPPPVYCSRCGVRVKRNAQYYTSGSGDGRLCLCIPCYNECHGNTIKLDGVEFQKSKIEKKRNDEETEEAWVQCDECESWQHQICALFNGRRNEGGQAEYTCPSCYLDQIERGERIPLPDSAVLGAKDLPRTLLSDHIEQRLFRRLKQEREKRAQALGKLYDEVPGAESLVVRVVSSVDKKLEVKQRFFELFRNEGYPSEYPYKSKVILLFQKIEGVEVCLFGMYVQEYGSDASLPNQRRIYLAYLDSVKYFRPDVKTSSGEALRTFVYHEILIGYLEYCKERGFTSCYIWACPPLKGEDYILYCHPEIQKTPKSDKLREWYLTMLRKASKENIVVETTNLYDYFFVSAIERKTKVTAARLPYFEGDYWPGAAEDMLMQFQEEEDGKRQQKTKKTITKRSLKAAALSEPGGNLSKDLLLMRKLGDTIHQMKEDFIMVHLQHACTHCCSFITRGYRWTCKQCKNFQLCESCHDTEQRLDEKNRHPINAREKHLLSPVKVDEIAADTKDKDDIIESEIFDTRQAFLSLCQGNHYQYDTLRRAKHSSMMILYHLHNPLAPAFVITCNICQQEVETGKGWHCETCPDFDVCNACYQNDRNLKHPHKLVAHSTPTEQVMTTQEDRQNRILQQRKYLELLVHASTCHTAQCQYRDCRKIKGVFRHASVCKVRYQGRCQTCVKTWTLLRIHARSCSVPRCLVPRCRDLKEHFKRIQTQSESRRRAAVNEMMRQRVAEVSGKK